MFPLAPHGTSCRVRSILGSWPGGPRNPRRRTPATRDPRDRCGATRALRGWTRSSGTGPIPRAMSGTRVMTSPEGLFHESQRLRVPGGGGSIGSVSTLPPPTARTEGGSTLESPRNQSSPSGRNPAWWIVPSRIAYLFERSSRRIHREEPIDASAGIVVHEETSAVGRPSQRDRGTLHVIHREVHALPSCRGPRPPAVRSPLVPA